MFLFKKKEEPKPVVKQELNNEQVLHSIVLEMGNLDKTLEKQTVRLERIEEEIQYIFYLENQ